MTIPAVNFLPVLQFNNCIQNIHRLISSFSQSCHKVVTYCFQSLFRSHGRSENDLSQHEITVITDYGKALHGSSPDSINSINDFFNKLIGCPLNINKKLVKELHRFERKCPEYKSHHQDYGKGLRALRDASYAFSWLGKNNAEESINRKLSHISKYSFAELAKNPLNEAEKLTINEIYLVNVANEMHQQYDKLKLHCPIPALEQKFQVKIEFYQKCDQAIKNCWNDIHNDGKTIIFFSEKKYQAAYKKSPTLSTKIMKFGRRGDALHVALLSKEFSTNRPIQVHVAKDCYQETPVRFIELLGNDAFSLDLSSILTIEGKKQLAKMHSDKSDTSITIGQSLQQIWDSELQKLVNLQKKMNTKNSVNRQLLCSAKWFGFPPERVIIGSSKTSPNMVCSEFIITFLSQMIENVEKELKTSLFKYDSEFKNIKHFLNNPFKSMCAATMTPADTLRALKPYSKAINSISPYLNAIIANFQPVPEKVATARRPGYLF